MSALDILYRELDRINRGMSATSSRRDYCQLRSQKYLLEKIIEEIKDNA